MSLPFATFGFRSGSPKATILELFAHPIFQAASQKLWENRATRYVLLDEQPNR
jgi:hypothetical protein